MAELRFELLGRQATTPASATMSFADGPTEGSKIRVPPGCGLTS
jgi:hypothetical protein